MMIDDVEVTLRNARVPCARCRVSYYIPSRVPSGKLLYRCVGCGSCTTRRDHHQRKAAIMRTINGDGSTSGDFYVRMPNESVVAASTHFERANSPIALERPYAGVTIDA